MTTILCDIDGVVCDFIGGVCNELNERNLGPVHPGQFTDFHLSSGLTTKAQLDFVEILSHRSGFCSSLSWYEGAHDFIKKISKYDTYALTAPWKAKTWAAERVEWLAGVLPSERIISCPTESKHMVQGNVLIEDNLDTARRWLYKNSGYVILIDRPWNQGDLSHWNIYRAKTYSEALNLVLY